MVETLHAAIYGRARFRIKELYRCDSLKEHIERRLGADPAVISAGANTLTSAVLVRYNSGATLEDIRSLVEKTVSEFNQSYETDIEDHRVGGQSVLSAVPNRPPSAPPHCAPRRASRVRRPAYGTWRPAYDIRHSSAPGTQSAFRLSPPSAEVRRRRGFRARLPAKSLRHLALICLPEAPRRSKFEIFLNQLNSLPVALLGVAAGISVLTGGIVDAVAIMTVVAINSSIGFVTENEAERTISSLKTLMHPSAVVVRDGARRRIDASRFGPRRPGDP